MNTPKIRFKGFTDDWEQRKLGELCNITTGKLDANAMVSDGQYDFYTSGIDVFKIDVAAFEGPAITIAGNGASVGYMHLADGKFNAYQRTYVLTDFLADRQFLNVAIGNELPNKIQEEVRGSGIPYIVLNMLTDLAIPFPSHEEQYAIGVYFQQLDHLITLHQRKCDETKQLKKFMLQKMFPKNGEKNPEIRFEGFTDDWEQRKLGEVCEIKDSARIPNSEWSESGVPYIRASDVTNENTDGVLFISQERYEFYKNRTGAPTKDDVLFNGGGEIGKSLLITDEKPIYVQGGAVLYAQTSKSRELVGQYLKTYFETTNAKSYIDAASAGGTMRHFTLKPSQIMRILMPSVEEQEKIGEYFANLDQLITLHQRKCEKLKELKKFMLQNMFV